MINFKFFIFVFALLLLVPISMSIGTTTYPNVGGVDQDFVNEGRGEFIIVNGEFDFELFGKNLADSMGTPIVSDLDNNSINELIIVDEDNVRIYQNKELDIISTIDFGNVPPDISNILAFDIDGDGFQEIVFLALDVNSSSDNILIFNFSQSEGIQLQTSFQVETAVQYPMIGCRAANECLVATTSGTTVNIFDSFTAFHQAYSFDSTAVTGGVFTIFSQVQASSNTIALCSPRDKNIMVNDYDNDGNVEYILSMGLKEASGGNTVEYHIFWLDNQTQELTGSEAESVSDLGVGCGGFGGLTNAFTSPVIAEIDSGEPRKEAIIGAQSSANDFRIFYFSGSDGDKVDEFPESLTLLEADGTIISNVMFGNFLADTQTDDVCVMGFDQIETRYELLCGSQERGLGFSHAIFNFDFSVLGFNVSTDILAQHHLIHGVQFSNSQELLNDVQEVLTTYGVFQLVLQPTGDLIRIFDPETTRGVNIAVDLEQFGQDDIISMTDTNIFYFDDKGSNNPAIIVDITYDPCPINTLIKVNTTMQVTVEARDQNTAALGFDDITFTTFSYFGDINQENRTLPNISTSQIDGSATVIYAPNFPMNKTITNGVIRTEVFDVANPTEIDSNEQLFSVAQTGLEFGDATCTVEVEITPEEEEAAVGLNISAEAQANEGLNNFFEGASNEFKVTGLVVVLFLMLAWSIAVLTTKDRVNDSMITMNKVVFMLVGNAFIFIIAVVAGAISFGALLVFIILGIVAIGVWARRFFTSTPM